ncbi:MAG TPA: class I SAM-dependent methyltransferase [Myxococcota bacterium]
MNRTRIQRHPLRALWRLDSFEDYHGLLFDHALGAYLERAKRSGHAPGSLLAVGACWREAQALVHTPFERIVLSGISEPDEAIQKACDADPRVRFEYANAEHLPFASGSFDLVFCKESLHHLARPVLGLYEMLRVCRRAVVFVEPWSCALVRLLDCAGLTTRYERGQRGNLRERDNFVYRWTRRQLESLLCSLYLESGYELELTVGWLSTRAQVRRPRWIRRLAALGGHLASWTPGARGNFATALIAPGRDLPPDPAPHPDPSAARSSAG